jgi:hypothetical protein
MQLEERNHIIQRGLRAKELLKNETLLECFDELLMNAFTKFVASESGSFDEREKLWDIGQGLKLVKGKLEAYVDDGKMEEVNKKHDDNI